MHCLRVIISCFHVFLVTRLVHARSFLLACTISDSLCALRQGGYLLRKKLISAFHFYFCLFMGGNLYFYCTLYKERATRIDGSVSGIK